jgi:hypothetical protein
MNLSSVLFLEWYHFRKLEYSLCTVRYSVMYTRMLHVLIQVLFRLSFEEALDLGFPLSVALNSGLAEIYIQMYLSEPCKKGSFQQAAENAVTDRGTKKVS